ncbi:MAG: MBL fold metallo-hydrolase [Candidatus Bipolaricaulis sp.]|nr:MBL fold metallo-hydrolase [Candidatus Bipolaricaulis sp.]MDD5220892.1 MBL fold metallo-hydrolase [Candidatus Bipolaricaulis sp.]MDD5647104.1 MBL fold metallo-hydrolase [Candidatus Bipolaricaulis sp.]
MKITWIGHSCFQIATDVGTVVTDPFAKEVPYKFPQLSADIVAVSHGHHDHNAVDRVGGHPKVVQTEGTHSVAKGLRITGIPSLHDDAGGTRRGKNLIFVIEAEQMVLAHLGDLGVPLTPEQRDALLRVDVLFAPVGGYYTIDAATAAALVRSLPSVRVVCPMHYRTDRNPDWPIAPVDDFLRTMDNVRHIGSSSVILTRETLPEALEVWVLDHA